MESIEKSHKLYPSMRAEINALAVCDEDGTMLFEVQKERTGASHITRSGGIPIRSIRLDTYLTDKGLDRVDPLKLDIEGYELAAFRGAKLVLKSRRIKAFYFEYCEKFLVRVAPSSRLIEFLDSLSCEGASVAIPILYGKALLQRLRCERVFRTWAYTSPSCWTASASNDRPARIPRENLISV
jgi:FkbM family methyltransferase